MLNREIKKVTITHPDPHEAVAPISYGNWACR
jgi:hypothetical protein